MSGAACASIAPPRALTQRRTLRNALAAERTAVATARNARARRNRGTNLTTCQADLGGPSEPHVRGRDISTWALSRRAWATVTDLGSTLPPLLPWAAERVATWQEAWQKASALASNMPIAVVDLMPVEGQENENKSPFETKIGAYIYDKGYRQLFRALGYPGADAEAALALVKINRPEGGVLGWTDLPRPLLRPGDHHHTARVGPPRVRDPRRVRRQRGHDATRRGAARRGFGQIHD